MSGVNINKTMMLTGLVRQSPPQSCPLPRLGTAESSRKDRVVESPGFSEQLSVNTARNHSGLVPVVVSEASQESLPGRSKLSGCLYLVQVVSPERVWLQLASQPVEDLDKLSRSLQQRYLTHPQENVCTSHCALLPW